MTRDEIIDWMEIIIRLTGIGQAELNTIRSGSDNILRWHMADDLTAAKELNRAYHSFAGARKILSKNTKNHFIFDRALIELTIARLCRAELIRRDGLSN